MHSRGRFYIEIMCCIPCSNPQHLKSHQITTKVGPEHSIDDIAPKQVTENDKKTNSHYFHNVYNIISIYWTDSTSWKTIRPAENLICSLLKSSNSTSKEVYVILIFDPMYLFRNHYTPLHFGLQRNRLHLFNKFFMCYLYNMLSLMAHPTKSYLNR